MRSRNGGIAVRSSLRGSDVVDSTLPPVEYMRLVSGEHPNLREHFESAGRRLAAQLAQREMLEPGSRLLDIGCGCGRVARHLLDSPIAAYAGFDRHPGMIEWAQSHIGDLDSRFQFQHVDVESGYTGIDNNVGSVAGSEFDFPYEDGSFTGALAASVFTHLDFATTRRYLAETARVLGQGGRALGDYFPGETTGPLRGSTWNFVIRADDMRLLIEQAGLDVLIFHPAPATGGHSFFLLEKRET
jgi:ubiquinone/menaquinone biosynthesis C-methylase UbiE